MKFLSYSVFAALSVLPLSGQINVMSVSNNMIVQSPFGLQANAPTCQGQPTASMGYSFDSSSNTQVFYGNSFSAEALANVGVHILHVKCWGSQGAADVHDLTLNVSSSPVIPANVSGSLQALSTWQWNDDPGTQGYATGTSALVSYPSISGQSRRFSVDFSNGGGEIYHTTFGSDTVSSNFIYDAYLWISGSAADVANIEADLNQVMANGQTVIYGVQCDGYSGTWDYTVNTGSSTSFIDTWKHSSARCPKPSTWTPNAWHHLQFSYSRDESGNVTYHAAWLDGVEYVINATGNSAFALGWGSVLLTNFQIDGMGSGGSATAYLDNVSVYRW
jgi:hypothetical protein